MPKLNDQPQNNDSEFRQFDSETVGKLLGQLQTTGLPSFGGVRIIRPAATSLPHPFKCSKCEYIGTSRQDTNKHYDDEHYKE